MILSCDPPRHAFLIHFGARQQPHAIELRRANRDGAKVEFALNPHSAPPTLVAVHFVRHGFRLPFVGANGQVSSSVNFHCGYRQDQYFFNLSYEPRDCQAWPVAHGLTVLIAPGRTDASPSSSVEARPVLHGLIVDPRVLRVDVDMNEFVFECGADHLKDVSAALFVRYS